MRVLIDSPQFERLQHSLDAIGEEVPESMTLPGMLVGIDSDRQTFHLAFDDGDDIKGTIDESVLVQEPARVPARYSATLIRTTRTVYSLESDEVSWVLTKLVLT